jgi:regulator of replication initiation timing/predicted transcriptional regulator
MERAGKKMQAVGKKMSLTITAPLLGLGAVAVANFDKQAKAIAQVEQGLKTTGNQVGKTSKQLQDMASELQNNSLFGDEEILKDATAQLLTFTNIANKEFDRTQQAALDLATRLDGDLKSASIQLGKALNDPVANLSALSRSGIQFSVDQKQMINSLVKTNKLADAQNIILDELEKQYGGSAKAAAEAGAGGFKQLSNTLGDVLEGFGKIISEALLPFAKRIKEVAQTVDGFSSGTKKTIVVVAAFAAALGPLLIITGTLVRNIGTLIPLVKTLSVVIAANPIGAFAAVLAAVAATALIANSRFTELTDAQKEFSSITASATGSIAEEKAQLEKLLTVARDDTASKEDRIAAIKELNTLSPDYLGGLTLETINTDKAKTATDDYVTSLLQKARVMAAQDKLVEVQKQLLDLQLGQNDAAKPSIWQNLGNAVLSAGNAYAFTARSSASVAENMGKEGSELRKLQDKLTSFLGDNDSLITSNKKVSESFDNIKVPDVSFTRNEKTVSTVTAKTEIEPVGNPLDGLAAALPEQKDLITAGLDEIGNKFYYLQELGYQVGSAVGDAFDGLSSRVVDSLGLADQGFQGFVKGLAGTITKLISMMLASSISQAISSATSSALATGPGAVFAQPAFIATAVGGVLSAFAAIPKFEAGGVVGGSSYYGDKILARVNSQEMILNTDQQEKLYGMMQPSGGSQAFIATTRIKGSDLLISYTREKNKNSRF